MPFQDEELALCQNTPLGEQRLLFSQLKAAMNDQHWARCCRQPTVLSDRFQDTTNRR
jgi:DnaJ-domain-containing protein 1